MAPKAAINNTRDCAKFSTIYRSSRFFLKLSAVASNNSLGRSSMDRRFVSLEFDPSDLEADPSDRGVSPFDSDSDVDSASTVLKEGFFVRTIVMLKGERKSTGDNNLSDGDKKLDRTPFGTALCLDFFYHQRKKKKKEEERREEEEAKRF
ncbi:hypothetical protein TorRG33x02_038200 [Trema orientale]|uniref:Uncharacterized protein n=1 Tax=Trema orientale TaxID=63057 RepID=A0A2P5FRH6_TREOI|nr:hypothetical protein TorRG33x02_038200 [Trema orientale]